MSLIYHGPLVENNACKGPHRGEAMFNCRSTAQVPISPRKTMAAGRGCSITRTPLEHGDRKNLAQRTVGIVCVTTSRPPQRQETIHFLMVVASRTPCQACTHDGGGRVLNTQLSAGTLDTNTNLRLPAGTAARAKIKHPRSAEMRQAHPPPGGKMQHCRQLLHKSVFDAFAMHSKLSKFSLCKTQKSGF